MQDIVRNLVIKFSAKTDDVTKGTKAMEDALKRVSKLTSGTGAGNIGASLAKSLEKANKEAAKLGGSLGSGASKLQKVIQEIATRDLNKMGQEINKIAGRAEQRLQSLSRLEARISTAKAAGGSPESIAAMEARAQLKAQRLRRESGTLTSMSNQYSMRAGGAGGSGGGSLSMIGMGVGAIGALAGAGSAVAYGLEDWSRTKLESRASIGETLKQRYISQVLQGNLTEQMMQVRNKSLTKSMAYAESQTKKHSWGKGLLAAGGLSALIIGGTLAAAPFTGGASLALLPEEMAAGAATGTGALIAGGAGLATMGGGAYSMFDATKFFGAGGRQAYEAQQFNKGMQMQRNLHMTDYYMNELSKRAPEQFNFLRQMGMGTSQGLDFRTAMRHNLISGRQGEQIALSLRSQFGGAQARSLAEQVGSVYAGQGVSMGAAQQLVSGVALNSVSGQGQSKQVLKEMFSDAFARGFKDSGVIEALEKTSIRVGQTSGGYANLRSVMDQLSSILQLETGGKTPTGRQLSGMESLPNILNQGSMQGGIVAQFKGSYISRHFAGNPVALAAVGGMNYEQIASIASNPVAVASYFNGNKAAAQRFAKGYVQNYFGIARTVAPKELYRSLHAKSFTDAQNIIAGVAPILTGNSNLTVAQEQAFADAFIKNTPVFRNVIERRNQNINKNLLTGVGNEAAQAQLASSVLSEPSGLFGIKSGNKAARDRAMHNLITFGQSLNVKFPGKMTSKERSQMASYQAEYNQIVKGMSPAERKLYDEDLKHTKSMVGGDLSTYILDKATARAGTKQDTEMTNTTNNADLSAAAARQNTVSAPGGALGTSVQSLIGALQNFAKALPNSIPANSSTMMGR